MQVFGNVATPPEKVIAKSTGRAMVRFRLAESHRGLDGQEPTWYSVLVSKSVDLGLSKGDFVKVTGRLKVDSYVGKDGKPASGLVLLAFEAAKIAKPAIAAAGTAQAVSATSAVPPLSTAAVTVTPTTISARPATPVCDWTD